MSESINPTNASGKQPVTFVLPGGVEKQAALQAGQRVVSAGFALGLDEIGFGDCGGNAICGTCHVRVVEGSFAPPQGDELAVLDTFPKLYPNSRLACQLRVTAETGPIKVEWVG